MSSLLDRYAELVAEWGKKMNLVSDPEIRSIKAQHVDDCVRAYQCLTANLGAETVVELPIVDIGSGAGFPGVVWAILDPTTKTFLIEPREKRVTFLRHIAAKLQLKNIEVICSRFEDLPREQLPSRCLFTMRS
jgi:16S rRNA (guanine527-N7)-methyltransferase